MESLKTALLVNVGTTAEPIIKALETAAHEGALTLFLAYGRAISDQEKPPIDVANNLCEKAKQLGVGCMIYELNTPEEFEGCFTFYQQLMDEVGRREPERVILDVTDGTKVMSAALIHAALIRQWGAEVIFEYVGGLRDTTGRVREMELKRDGGIVTRERIITVLDSIRWQEFARAVFLADSLPKHGKAGFLKNTADILWQWDNFHYDETVMPLEALADQAKALLDDGQFQRIAGTLLRLQKVAGGIKLATGALRQLKEKGCASLSQDMLDGWMNILSDTIANARRRAKTDPTDCVLRCYRAIEVATQIVVLKFGVNPWKPDWKTLSDEKLAAYVLRIHSQEPPRQLSLDSGIKLIEVITSPFSKDIHQSVLEIMNARNHSYLEHGYGRVLATAWSSMKKMEGIIPVLLSRACLKDNPVNMSDQLRIEA